MTGYDKIERVYECALPGGISFPLKLVKTIWRAYDTSNETLGQDEALSLLAQVQAEHVRRAINAGQILSSTEDLSLEDGWYLLRGVTEAREMIARTQYINPLEQ